MPTTYTSDSDGAPLAPDLGQTPEGTPKLALPIDGEAANAASIAQAFKALGNWVARALKPKGSTDPNNRYLWRGRTSVGHTRFALDRNGLPAGTCLQMQERWGNVSGSTSLGWLVNYPYSWTTVGAAGFGAVFTYPATLYAPGAFYGLGDRTGVMRIAVSAALNDAWGLQGSAMCGFHADADIAWEAIIIAEDDAGVTKPDLIAGFTDSCTANPRAMPGVYFWRDITQANWQAVSRDATSETVVDTLVPVTAGAHVRARIEYRGANVNDGAVASVYYYLDQTLVATITTTLPVTGLAAPLFVVKNTHGTAVVRPTGPADLYVGPVAMACNVMPSVTT
jgi:hypothetical protein